MKELLRRYEDTDLWAFRLGDRLVDLLEAGIIERDGAFLFAMFGNLVPFTPSRFGDLTGYECAVNHVHIEDLLDPAIHGSHEVLFKSGATFALRLKEELESAYPQVGFRIVLSYSLDGPQSCVVRFHKVRMGEEWLKMDDLDGYRSEALMVIEVEGRQVQGSGATTSN
jgi:hypothetical protein